MNLDNVIFVWGESQNPASPAPPPTVSVSAWPFLFDKTWLRWNTFYGGSPTLEFAPPEVIKNASVAFVNLFWTADSIHISQIRAVNPDCYIVAMPDMVLDMVLTNPGWTNVWEQMAQADMIGGRTHADCDVYGTLLNKPTCYFPSPIGPTEFFLPYRDLPKEDYLLTLDHAFSPANTACNVAAVAAIQRETGIRVIYAAARDHTRHLADLAGLKAEWPGHVNWFEFVEMTAKARLCVDMYASHSYGRQQVLSAMVNTPCIGSNWCSDAPSVTVDPFDPREVVEWVKELFANEHGAKLVCQKQMALVERNFSFTASRARLLHLLERIENERVKG